MIFVGAKRVVLSKSKWLPEPGFMKYIYIYFYFDLEKKKAKNKKKTLALVPPPNKKNIFDRLTIFVSPLIAWRSSQDS